MTSRTSVAETTTGAAAASDFIVIEPGGTSRELGVHCGRLDTIVDRSRIVAVAVVDLHDCLDVHGATILGA